MSLNCQELRELVDRFQGLVGYQVCRLRVEDQPAYHPRFQTNMRCRQPRINRSARQDQWNSNALASVDIQPLRGLGCMTRQVRTLLCLLMEILREMASDNFRLGAREIVKRLRRRKDTLNAARNKAAMFEKQLHRFVNPNLVTSLNRRAAKAACEAENIGRLMTKLRKQARKSARCPDKRMSCCELVVKMKSLLVRQKCEWQCVGRLKETMAIAGEMKNLLKYVIQLTHLLDQNSNNGCRRSSPERPPSYEITCGLADDSFLNASSQNCGDQTYDIAGCYDSTMEMSSASPRMMHGGTGQSQSDITISVSLDLDDDDDDDDDEDVCETEDREDKCNAYCKSRHRRKERCNRQPSGKTESVDRRHHADCPRKCQHSGNKKSRSESQPPCRGASNKKHPCDRIKKCQKTKAHDCKRKTKAHDCKRKTKAHDCKRKNLSRSCSSSPRKSPEGSGHGCRSSSEPRGRKHRTSPKRKIIVTAECSNTRQETPRRHGGDVSPRRHGGDVSPCRHGGDVSPCRHGGDVSPRRHRGDMSPRRHGGDVSPRRHGGDMSPCRHGGNVSDSYFTANSTRSHREQESLSEIIEKCVSECMKRKCLDLSTSLSSPPKSKPNKERKCISCSSSKRKKNCPGSAHKCPCTTSTPIKNNCSKSKEKHCCHCPEKKCHKRKQNNVLSDIEEGPSQSLSANVNASSAERKRHHQNHTRDSPKKHTCTSVSSDSNGSQEDSGPSYLEDSSTATSSEQNSTVIVQSVSPNIEMSMKSLKSEKSPKNMVARMRISPNPTKNMVDKERISPKHSSSSNASGDSKEPLILSSTASDNDDDNENKSHNVCECESLRSCFITCGGSKNNNLQYSPRCKAQSLRSDSGTMKMTLCLEKESDIEDGTCDSETTEESDEAPKNVSPVSVDKCTSIDHHRLQHDMSSMTDDFSPVRPVSRDQETLTEDYNRMSQDLLRNTSKPDTPRQKSEINGLESSEEEMDSRPWWETYQGWKDFIKKWWKFILLVLVNLFILYILWCPVTTPGCFGCHTTVPNIFTHLVSSARRSVRLMHYSQATF